MRRLRALRVQRREDSGRPPHREHQGLEPGRGCGKRWSCRQRVTGPDTYVREDSFPGSRVFWAPAGRLQPMPVIKQCLIVYPPTPGRGMDEWAERGSEPGAERALPG